MAVQPAENLSALLRPRMKLHHAQPCFVSPKGEIQTQLKGNECIINKKIIKKKRNINLQQAVQKKQFNY